MTKAQCLLDLPIASYPAMYEYLDKNNFEVGMQLLGATNKANIRKQYLHLSVKLHPDKDQTNIHATERFALPLRTYEMLQKMIMLHTIRHIQSSNGVHASSQPQCHALRM